MVRQMTNIHWLWVAIHLCGGRPKLAKQCKIGEGRITAWLNETRKITLKNAIKIEKATNGQVTRDQLVSDRDKTFINDLKSEVDIIQRSQPLLTFKQRVELGLAHEAALGCRKGARTDLQLSKNFNEVNSKSNEKSTEKPTLQGRTEELAAKLAGFGNFITYHQAKKIIKNGIPELIETVEKGLAISRAAKISEFSSEKQRYFLSLDKPLMIKALLEAASEKNADKWKKINNSNIDSTKSIKEKICPRCESLAILTLLNMKAGLFQERKRKEIVGSEQKVPIISQNTI